MTFDILFMPQKKKRFYFLKTPTKQAIITRKTLYAVNSGCDIQ
jgi:hypothetical protein